MLNITIKTIQHRDQRYETVGDWVWDKNGGLHIYISDMRNWRYEALVAVHELCEVLICKYTGVKQGAVDAFDIQFEKEREQGLHGPDDEPGDHPKAPYRRAHFVATKIERILALALWVNWRKYGHRISSL